jgi:adenylate cyclase
MPLQVLLIQQPDSRSTDLLYDYFTEWGDQVSPATEPAQAQAIAAETEPDLVIIELHQLKTGWEQWLSQLRETRPDTKILFTTNYPDYEAEAKVRKVYGTQVFLRQPITKGSIELALRSLEGGEPLSADQDFKSALPRVRVPVRTKITFPYLVLALLLALGAAYLVSQVIVDTIEERFTNQLIEAGKLSNDWIVKEEDQLLETLRLVVNTQGVPEAVNLDDAEQLRQFALPVAVNYQTEAIELLNQEGVSILSLRHIATGKIEDYNVTRGDNIFSQWDFVREVMAQNSDQAGNKYAGLARAPWGDYLYVAGPIIDEQGRQVGVILVGQSLPTMVRAMRQDILANITLYDLNGEPLASTFAAFGSPGVPLPEEFVLNVLEAQDQASLTRPLDVSSIDYTEIVGPWEVREFLVDAARSNNDLGLIGASLAETFLARPSQVTRMQVFVLTAITFILVIGLGIFLANRITNPLLEVVDASAQVAQGNLEVQIEPKGDDEVAVLAHSFNHMVAGLREGSIYRDLFGRTVSPAVVEQLRKGFAAGDIRLEGQQSVATVLMSDIRGFTALAEEEAPETIMNWLNEYFGELVPVITSYGGVVSKFEGDAVLAFFGILPRPVPPQESAYRACRTAMGMLDAIKRLNERRIKRGDPPFVTGIGINTGPVTAGGLGSADRLHYTIIGDAVNTTARLEGLTREFGNESSAVISQHTLFAMRDLRHEFELESMGVHNVKGKVEQLLVYRIAPAQEMPKEAVGDTTDQPSP